jgi:fumarylacetoacetate (FAA) hydrolase family protein
MRRVQIHLEESMDDRLAAEAARQDVSKAALIRTVLAETVGSDTVDDDPFDDLVGSLEAEPIDIDTVVYG